MRLLHDRIIVLITLVALFVAGAIPFAHGQGFESALEGFAADSYSDTDTAISAVAASGDVMAASVIEALQDGRLLFHAADKKVFVKDKSGAILNAATGKPAL